jgi:Fic family protein/DNA-binding XRE family transcriptional regulator
MKNLLKNAREQKQLKTRELSQLLGIDQALISKFESGSRKPTREQVLKLATILEIDYETIMITWLKEKILYEIGDENLALQALSQAQEEIQKLRNNSINSVSKALQQLLDEIDAIKVKLDRFRQFESRNVIHRVELEFIFESNRLEGNTLTLQETELVINQGMTIAGKTMKEHLEVINHMEAISYVRGIVEKSTAFTEKDLLAIHYILSRGIQLDDAGKYRKTAILQEPSEGFHSPAELITKEMEELFNWYESHKNTTHPVLLAAEIHLKIKNIMPFGTNNGKTARLAQNLILLQHGYVVASNKGDTDNKVNYENLLRMAQNSTGKESFLLFIGQTEKECLEQYIGKIAQ